jgi:serine/threonine protein kinase
VYRDIKPDNIGILRKPHAQCTCGKRSNETTIDPLSSKQEDCTCFDEIPKLFDMGLCKELKPSYFKRHPMDGANAPNDTYKLTARSGSRRYMSPEVAFGEPYNEKADIYSFGVVLYQVASLVTPYEGYSMKRHEEDVLESGERPSLKIPSPKKALRSKVAYDQWILDPDNIKKAKVLSLLTKCVWPNELKHLIQKCWHDEFRARPSMKDVVKSLEKCIEGLALNSDKTGHRQCSEGLPAVTSITQRSTECPTCEGAQ